MGNRLRYDGKITCFGKYFTHVKHIRVISSHLLENVTRLGTRCGERYINDNLTTGT